MGRDPNNPGTDVRLPLKVIETYIHLVRGRRVMRDTDLAKLYGVETFNLK